LNEKFQSITSNEKCNKRAPKTKKETEPKQKKNQTHPLVSLHPNPVANASAANPISLLKSYHEPHGGVMLILTDAGFHRSRSSGRGRKEERQCEVSCMKNEKARAQ